jgi:regulator of cell morphogenesis and NO signaling
MNYSGLITKNQKLAHLLHTDIELLSLLRRFNITLGFGDSTIDEVCKSKNINIDFFLEIVNIYHNKSYFPKTKLQGISISVIVDFLKKSHKYYNEEIIPTIEHLIHQLVWEDKNHDRNLKVLKKFFNEYRKEVKAHTTHEEETVYPYTVYIEELCMNTEHKEKCREKMKEYSITNYAEEHNNIEEKLTDLKNIIIKYLPPSQNQDIAFSILRKLFKLEKDLNHHAAIEEKVLVPKILDLEKTHRE